MKKYLKRIGLAMLLLLAVVIIWQHELIFYGISQGYGQVKIILLAKPVEDYLANKTFPDSLKAKLRLVQEIRQFAFDSLGINYSDNYTTLYDLRGDTPMWMLTACSPFSFEVKEWDFPIIGRFSYKGYFDSSQVAKEEEILKKQGYDTDVGEISGWSTLGWFKDPILSNMLERSEGSLANLIIHELTHGTLYVKNNVDYNENLASFVGDVGALKFMEYKFGPNSPQAKRYINSKNDYEKYSNHVLRGTQKLDSLYHTFDKSMTTTQKLNSKNTFIATIMQSMDTIKYSNRHISKFEKDEPLPNNTYFMHYVRYRKQQNTFETEFLQRFHGDFKKYFIYLKKTYPSL